MNLDDYGNPTGVEGDPNSPDPNQPQQPKEPYHDIAYWQTKGYGTNDMFDANGQMKPGWSRTANGYDFDPSKVTAPAGPGGGGGGGPLIPPNSLGTLLKPFDQPPPGYVDPSYPGAPAFPTLPTWNSPTEKDAENLPGYAFARDQALQGAENSAAARGVTNTGGTLEDIIKFGNQFASQNYQTARQNSLDDYTQNVQNQFLLPYAAKASNWQTMYPQAGIDAQNKNNFNWNNYLQGYNIFRNNQNDPFNKLFSVASLGSGLS